MSEELPTPGGRRVIIHRLAADVILPERASPNSSIYELRAYLLGSKVKLNSGERGPDTSVDPPIFQFLPGQAVVIPLGFRAIVPAGYEIQIRPHPRVVFQKRIAIISSPDTIDATVRGELGVVAMNLSAVRVTITHGEVIARMVVSAVADVPICDGPPYQPA